jgi:hypothetical protein
MRLLRHAETFRGVRRVQRERFAEVAREVASHPNRAEAVTALLGFPLSPIDWCGGDDEFPVKDGEWVSRALYEIGQFEAALPWYERAVSAKEKGDVHGRIDRESLCLSVQSLVECLEKLGRTMEVGQWKERMPDCL